MKQSVRIEPIIERESGPINLIIAGYRSSVCGQLIGSAALPGSTYAVRWAAGKWAEAGASAGVLARSLRLGVPAIRAGQVMTGIGALATGAGGVLGVGAGQFRHRLWCAQRDGKKLAECLDQTPAIHAAKANRPLNLYGHSLGTVVVRNSLPQLRELGFRVDDVTLMGGAASRKGWVEAESYFSGRLLNLYSPKDHILSVAPILDRLVGTGAIDEAVAGTAASDRFFNRNVCGLLPSPLNAIAHHSGYWKIMPEAI